MINNLDPAARLFLSDTQRIQQNIADANRQVSSGSRISQASDAPDQIAPLLQLRSALQQNTQIQTNLGVAQADANAADNALTDAIQLMNSALSMANQGTSPAMTNTGRQSLANQVQSLQEQMVQLSLTSVSGRYIFSGDQSASPAYALDLTVQHADDGTVIPSNGVTQLIATQLATRQVADPAGGSFTDSKTAQEIFDDGHDATANTFAGDNVFNALNSLRLALLTNDTSQIGATLSSIHSASDHLNAMQAYYGNVEDRIQSATDYASTYAVRLKTQISQIQDADIPSATMELTQANTQLQAAFQMRAKLPQSSLFDFLG